jgi:AraC family transcriptional regulator
MEVKITHVDSELVAALEYRGSPSLLDNAVARFIKWRKVTGLSPVESSRTYGIFYDNPDTTKSADFRFDICGSVKEEIPVNTHGVITKLIPGGRCAVIRHVGSRHRVSECIQYLYRQWLPESNEELRDFPVYFEYLNLGFDLPESEQQTDVYLPLKSIEGIFA